MRTKMRKPIAVLLSALMLLTVVSVGLVPLAAFAGVTAEGELPALTFYVPETIYLNASDNKTFQYFVNREQTDAGALRTAQDTTGLIYFNCPEATEITNLTCGGASVNLSTTTPSATTLKATVNSGALSSVVSMRGTALVPWTVTFSYQGVSRTATAYSMAYAPNRNVTADGATGVSYNNGDRVFASGMIWIEGAQVTGEASYNDLDDSSGYRVLGYQNITGNKILDPLVNGVGGDTSGGHNPNEYTNSSAQFSSATNSFAECHCIYYRQSTNYPNNDQWTMHNDYNATSAELTVDKSRYSNISQIPNLKLGFYVTDWDNAQGYKTWYVSDASDYVVWNDNTPTLPTTSNTGYGTFDILKHGYFGADNIAQAFYFDRIGSVLDNEGVYASSYFTDNVTQGSVGLKYQEAISFDLSSLSAGETAFRLYRGGCSGRSGNAWARSCFAVSLKVTAVDKGALRTLVNDCVGSYMQQHYTATTWSAYNTALQSAETALGDPEATASEISTAVSNLTTAKNGLVRGTGTATVNHVTASGITLGTETKDYTYGETVTASANTYTGYTYTSASPANLTAGDVSATTTNWTLTYTPDTYTLTYDLDGGDATNPASFNIETDTFTLAEPTKTGYTFTGWTGTGLTEPTKPLTIEKGSTGSRSYTANWEPVAYTLTLDTAGGDAIAPIEYTIESTDTIPQPTHAGYDFVEWTATDVQGNWTSGETYAVGMPLTNQYGNVTLQASWATRHDTTYTVNHYYMDADCSYPATPQAQTFIGTSGDVVNAADAAVVPANFTLDTIASDASVAILGDGTAALDLYYTRDAFTVTFDVDGTQTSDDYYYGAVPAYTGTAPTLAATGENTYTFLGWTADAAAEPGSDAAYYAAGNLPPVTADVTYYPYFGAAVNSYDITFTVEGVDTTLSFPYGATPAYNGIPTKAADAANTYAFSGWSPAIAAVTGEATYVAQFTATPISYLVRATAGAGSTITDVTGIYNYNDTVDFTVTVAEGYTGTPVVSVNGTDVDAASTNGNAYEYSVTVTGNTEITVADLSKQTFTVKFLVDGAETEKTVAYGDTPTYGSVPAKAATAQYTYAFTGWSPEIVPATADATYTAQFSETLRSYDISFVTPTGTNVISVPYGETPAPGFTPAKAADATNTYEFAGWSTSADGEVAALVAVDGTATYYAIFTATPIPAAKYLVTVNPGVGSTLSIAAGLYAAGTELSFTVTVDAAYSDSEPIVTFGDTVQQKTGKDGLVFSYALTVNADTEISVSDLTKNTYTITFNVEGDETTKTVSYGETPDAGFVPTKAQTTEYSYAFMGWNTAADGSGDPLAPATADETYYAVFTPTAIPAHTHSFDTFVRTVAATCVAGGYDEYICTCGMTEQRNPTSIAPANHAKDPITVGARAATETEDGYTGDVICPACGATITEGHVDPHTATPHVHSFDTLVSHADATCAAKAYDIYVCSCGEQQKVESGEVDPDNHAAAPMTVGQRDATTESYGYTGDVICPACDHVLSVGTVIEKLTVPHTHSFDTLIDSGEATCVAKAYTVYQCACGETERTETGEKNMNNHVGELKLLGAHAATATADGYSGDTYCLACGTMTEEGHVIDKLDPGHTHSFDTEIESAPATCVAKAYTIWQCECGDTKKVETGEKDAANHVGEIKLMGYHAATETADGYSGDKYCLACGELVEAGHVLEHTGSTTPENPTQPDDPGNNGGSNTDTRIPFLEWLRNFIKKLLALFKIGGGEGSIC